MDIQTNRDLSESKTLKVALPTRLHIRLHQVKILSGKNISDTVQDALEAYLDDAGPAQGNSDGEEGDGD